MMDNTIINQEHILLMLGQITPNINFATHPTWSFWPIVTCFKSNSFLFQVQILSFLIECCPNSWINLFAMIYDVGFILSRKTKEIKSIFIHCIAKYIESNDKINLNSICDFFIIAKRYILYKSSQEDNKELLQLFYKSKFFTPLPERNSRDNNNSNNDETTEEEEYNLHEYYSKNERYSLNSMSFSPSTHRIHSEIVSKNINSNVTGSLTTIHKPYIESCIEPYFSHSTLICKSHHKKKKKDYIYDFDGIKSKITSLDFAVESLMFGIRIDKDGDWNDEELAEVIINVYKKYPFPRFLNFNLVLCSFLLHYKPDIVQEHFKNVSFKTEEYNLHKIFIDLLNHHCKLTNIQPIFDSNNDESSFENGYKSLQKMNASLETEIMTHAKQLFFILKNELSEKPIQRIIETFQFRFDDIIAQSRQQMLLTSNTIRHAHNQNMRYWSKLWRSLAVKPAPWSANLGYTSYFKRDMVLCAFGCPFKMKRNWNFNPHNSNLELTSEKDKYMYFAKENISNELKMLNESQLLEISGFMDSSFDFKHSIFTIPCLLISPNHHRIASFSLFKNRIEINFSDSRVKVILLSEIGDLLFRTYLYHPTALEIFLLTGKSFFINFPHHKSISIIKCISSIGLPAAKTVQVSNFNMFFNQNGLKVLWQQNKISNFEYLMHLNKMSGRSFNDLNQYPIFPWLVIDFAIKSISPESFISKSNSNMNLYLCANSSSFDSINSILRDLRKPIGALNDQRLKKLMEKNKDSLYCSGPSNMLNVCNILIRVEPYTSLFLLMKDYVKKNESKNITLFESIKKCYENSLLEEDNFSELPPEFYFDFQFLKNSNKYEFNGSFGDVSLPNWAENSFELIYTLRKVLECDAVSLSLNHWIDLIWGYKQRGRNAVASYNAYNMELYGDPPFPTNTIPSIRDGNHTVMKNTQKNDIDKRSDLTSMTNNCKELFFKGQMPHQLFSKPHPVKNTVDKSPRPITQLFTVFPSIQRSICVAKIESSGNWKFKIFGIDTSGIMITHCTDFTLKHQKASSIRRSQPTLMNPDGLSMSKSTSDTTVSSGLSNSQIENEDLKAIGLNASRREIKGFASLKIDIFSRNNMAASLGLTKILVVSKENNRLYIIDISKGSINFENSISNVIGVTAYEEYIGVFTSDSVLNVYKTNFNNLLFVLPSYGGSITCCNINGKFFVVVIGTKDGKLIIYSLNKGNIVRSINLNGAVPSLLLVTNGWGFIVCYAQKISEGKLKHYVYVFSINGELIRKRKLDFEIAIWSSWTSNKAFDYMVISDDNGKLFAFEVFYCNIGEMIYRCNSRITTLTYLQDIWCISAATKDGRILFVPYEIIE